MLNIKDYQYDVAKILLDIESITFSFDNPFVLTSGHKSPVYVDCRKIISHTKERNIILNHAKNYLIQNKLFFELLAGGETAGIPYAAFLAEKLQKPMIYIRKKSKGFGKNKQIEGYFKKNQHAILIEDLATDGKSKVIFVEALRKANLKISDIFVIFHYGIFNLIDTPLSKLDVNIHSLCTWKNILEIIESNKILNDYNFNSLKLFLNDPIKWREKNE